MSKKINTKYIAETSTINDLSGRNAALNWFSDQSEEIKIEVMARHSSLMHQQRQPGEKITPEFSFSLLILAAKQIRIDQNAMRFKRDLSVAATEELSRKMIEAGKKPARKKGSKKLARLRKEFLPMIVLLRDQHDYSWSEIVKFLWNNHQFEVSKAYLQAAYKKLREEINHGK